MVEEFKNDRLGFSYDVLLALLTLCIPLSSAFPNVLLAPIAILLFFKFNRRNIYLKPVLFFVLTLAFLILLAFIKWSIFSEFDFYSRIFISLFLLVSVAHTTRLKYMERAFIMGTILAIFIAVYNIMAFENFKFSFSAFGNTAEVNELLHIERPYFGFLLALVVFLCLRRKGWLHCSIAVIASAFCLLIAARLSLGIIVLLWAVWFFQLLKPLNKWRIPLVLGTIFLCGIALFSNENIQKRFKIQGDLDQSMAKALDYEPRYVIWPCTFTTLGSTAEILFGVESNQQLEQRLVACYGNSIKNNDSKKTYYLDEKFNPHNQYLHILCLGGVVTLLLFLLGFGRVLSSGKVPFDLKVLTVMFLLFFMFEALLYRQLGCYLFGIFLGLLAREENYVDAIKKASL
ncbi:O-antigen ligase family protein [Flavimarina sp. Hel_I_48]|uniref:O-antigen ligase family protein n=1 Tax=Flavimarina sp. Hel_I_48 TaxID=1392488 RepID=UPI0004DF18F4|nr:O-antigen ligase family protein [Flavimarina sp. Hel_I_48]